MPGENWELVSHVIGFAAGAQEHDRNGPPADGFYILGQLESVLHGTLGNADHAVVGIVKPVSGRVGAGTSIGGNLLAIPRHRPVPRNKLVN
jgi:hypothetical protein